MMKVGLQSEFVNFVRQSVGVPWLASSEIFSPCITQAVILDTEEFIKQKSSEDRVNLYYSWSEDISIKKLQDRLEKKDETDEDKALVQKLKIRRAHINFRILLLTQPLTLFLGQHHKESMVSSYIARFNKEYQKLIDTEFSHYENKVVFVEDAAIRESINFFFLLRDTEGEKRFECALAQDNLLGAFYRLLSLREYRQVLDQYKDEREYGENGLVSKYLVQNYHTSPTETNTILVPKLKKLKRLLSGEDGGEISNTRESSLSPL